MASKVQKTSSYNLQATNNNYKSTYHWSSRSIIELIPTAGNGIFISKYRINLSLGLLLWHVRDIGMSGWRYWWIIIQSLSPQVIIIKFSQWVSSTLSEKGSISFKNWDLYQASSSAAHKQCQISSKLTLNHHCTANANAHKCSIREMRGKEGWGKDLCIRLF